MTSDADVVIVGGGPIGLALALGLSSRRLKRPLKTLVLEARDPRAFVLQGHDTRGSALTLATQSMFRALGLMDRLGDDIQEMRQIKVTDSTGSLSDRSQLLGFVTPEDEQAAAGLVENRLIAGALLDEVEVTSDITLRTHTSLKTLATGSGGAELALENGDTIKTTLVIGADGRNSVVRAQAEIKTESKAYGQTALTFSIAHDHPHEARAEEHFSSDGVFALLPLRGNRCSVVWATSADEAKRLMAIDAAAFETELAGKIGDHLGAVKLEGARQAYPLMQQLAEISVADRVALVGDAAHVIHPLAGLGLNLGFKDVAALADCVHDAVARGEDHGSATVLERYRRWRRFDTASTIAMINGMNQLFANEDPVLRMFRGLGLRAMDRSTAAKSLFMTEAAGQLGDLPRLMRGILPA
jgi:2-octaprenyl-6-methoxyphenol hydroxylase